MYYEPLRPDTLEHKRRRIRWLERKVDKLDLLRYRVLMAMEITIIIMLLLCHVYGMCCEQYM